VAMGFGEKADYMRLKYANDTPASNQYDVHVKDSISYISQS